VLYAFGKRDPVPWEKIGTQRDYWVEAARGALAAALPFLERATRDKAALLPAESIALTVALAQVERGEQPTPNVTAVCIYALARVARVARGGEAATND